MSGQEIVPSPGPCADASPLVVETVVVAGMTDGCAEQVASGASEWATGIPLVGSTLVLKGLTEPSLPDPEGRVYSHRHPAGW